MNVGKWKRLQLLAMATTFTNWSELSGPPKPALRQKIKNSDGSWVHSQERQVQRQAEYFKKLGSQPIVAMDLPFMPADETVQVLHQKKA